PKIRFRRYSRSQSQTETPAGNRVLLRAARARSRGACRHRPRPHRHVRGNRRAGPLRRGRRAQGAVFDDRRPVEVGRVHGRDRGCPPRARAAASTAAAVGRRVREDGARDRAAARRDRAPVRQAHRARADAGAQPLPRGAAGGAATTVEKRTQAEPPLRGAGDGAAAAIPGLRQRSLARHTRLRILVREPAPRPVRARRRSRVDRLRPSVVNVFVVGCGSWGTAFAVLLRDGGHDATLVCRDPEQARTIAATGHNPRYLQNVNLRGVHAMPVDGAPLDEAELIVLARPSRSFAGVAAALPGTSPVLSLTKGLDPGTGERLSTRVVGRAVAVLSGPNMAEEIAEGLPSAAVIASEDASLAEELQHAINSTVFRVYVNEDLVGV